MMPRSKRMQPVVRMAEDRERNDAREFGQRQRHLADMQQKLAELQMYRDEYARRFEAAGSCGLHAMQLRDYRMFLDRLSEAIAQQKVAIARACQEVDKHRQDWLQSRRRVQALDKVVERYQRQEHDIERRREQNECDEHSVQSLHRREKQ